MKNLIRRWLVRLAMAVLAVFCAVVCLVAGLVAPFVLDDLRVDRAVRVAALDWRDWGDRAGEERLQYELDHQRVGLHLGDDDCTLERLEGVEDAHRLSIACHWSVAVAVPATSYQVPLAFSSNVVVLEDGSLL